MNSGELALVSYVIDGDTVILENNEKARLIGIKAPKNESEQKEAEPFALEAKLALAELVQDVKVKIILGTEKKDRYGRTLAYLELQNGIDVQESLLPKELLLLSPFHPI